MKCYKWSLWLGLILISCWPRGVEAASAEHLKNVQEMTLGKIARISDLYPSNDTNSTYFKTIIDFSNKGYTIFNVRLPGKLDDTAGSVKMAVEMMKKIDTTTGKKNKYLVNVDIYTANSSSLLKDRLNNGKEIVQSSIICPNFAFVDVTDTNQRKYVIDYSSEYTRLMNASEIGSQVVGYLPYYGMYGETGIYVGDAGCSGRNGEFDSFKHGYLDVVAGYSVNSLTEFKSFYATKKTEGVIPANSAVDALVDKIDVNVSSTWPKPSEYEANRIMYAYYLMYRKGESRSFNGEIAKAIAGSGESKAIASFCYLPVRYAQAANGWADFPGADFCMAQIGTGTYGTRKILLETDCVGGSDYSGGNSCSRSGSNWFRVETERTIKMGGNTATFNRAEYWPDEVNAVTEGLNNRSSLLNNQYKYSRQIAILIPSYSRALIKQSSGDPAFRLALLEHNLTVVSKLNELGVSYDFISEDELFDLDGLKNYKVIVIHDQNLFSKLFPSQWQKFLARYAGVAFGDNNGSLDYAGLVTRVRNSVMNVADRCANICTNATYAYLENTSCRKTCPAATALATATPTIKATATPTIMPSPTVTIKPSATATIKPNATATPSMAKVVGDANGDGKVELDDFVIWRSEYLGNVTTKKADFNGDGKVELDDFVVWRGRYI